MIAVSLVHTVFWHEPAAATALLGALMGHPSLRSLVISMNLPDEAGREHAGPALGALVAANARALTELVISFSHRRRGPGPAVRCASSQHASAHAQARRP
jgi:hypothetical protein